MNYSVPVSLNVGDLVDIVVAPNGSNVADDSTVFFSFVVSTIPPDSASSKQSINASALRYPASRWRPKAYTSSISPRRIREHSLSDRR